MHNSIYLLQEREFINSNENIYKIGRTKQANIQRFNQYPKGSKLLLHIVCDDCEKIWEWDDDCFGYRKKIESYRK